LQDRPTAAELLQEVAALLEGDLLAATHGPLQHHVRVAGNLARIVQRELELGPDADARENAALAALLGHDGTTADLNDELARRLRAREAGLAQAAWPVLVAVATDKVAIVKPGHDHHVDG
jgi:Domain of unknown function (DUF6285)